MDLINKEPAPGKAVNNQSISRAITLRHSKRVSKLKKRYSPDQLTPKPPKRRKKTKTKHQSPSKKPVISKCYHDPIGISIREGGDSRPLPRCQYCNKAIPLNRWHVINRVKREGDGYNVKQVHIIHANLALSNDEFQQLLTILWSSSDVEIVQKRAA
jgi:hypothetical protein